MLELVLGLLIFLGVHSVRIFANDWRSAQLRQRGEATWKLGYTVLSILGFALIVWGYGLARQSPQILWVTPKGMNHLAALLTLIAFVMLAAAYVPRNAIKTKLRHPMVLGIKVWALAHLLANNNLADLLLFGGFLVWAVLCFRAARQRDRANPPALLAASSSGTAVAIGIGALAWAGFAFWGHAALIGVRPMG
ncbi:NnrU family protein [Roseateles oligotrophus]|uniref:NnrU family protein n=1 Tax=Roseateles oligotrophus TaxID=1769250 RepID=A0ABT2YDW1_9BURK|nr:NnrU family protein [Roseateles oligotrophus]MCV2368218.1 NnrU family protein [Roseateles oligotrophus]